MTIALATTLPLNDVNIARLTSLIEILEDLYCGIALVSPPNPEPDLIELIQQTPSIKLQIGKQKSENRRYVSLQQALEFEDAQHIHYCDGDHVLARVPNYLDDWNQMLKMIQRVDCLIIGRTPTVFESYPPALRETEKIINRVASHLLGRSVDIGAGTRGFSRHAAEYLLQHAQLSTHPIATDLEWPVILHGGGYDIDTYRSEGAIYEITSDEHRKRLEHVEQWHHRVNLADKIIQAGIEAYHRNSDSPYDARSLK